MKKYALNIEDRKVLVSRLMELTGLHSRYTFMPRCAYIVGSYTVEKEGTLVIEDNAAPEIIRTLLDESIIREEGVETPETEAACGETTESECEESDETVDSTEDTQPTEESGATAEESPEVQEPVDEDEPMDTVNDTDADEAPVPTEQPTLQDVDELTITIPFVQSIHTVSNKQQDKHIEAQIWGEASDKTPVYAADVIVTYQVLPEKSAWLYANVSDTKNLVGDELVASAIKSAMAELGPNEVTNRTKIEPLAQQKLAESLNQKYGEGAVFINKVVINNMDFEEAYNTAIQQKSIAQQNADKQKIENEAAIAKAEADKQVAITNAEAEAQKTSIAADAQAEANRKIAESLSDTLIEYQKIQKWDGKLPTVSGSNALVSFDPAE